jgi:RNA polymerase sigma factor (sigma-70 family)
VALFRAGHEEAFRAIHDRFHQRLFAYTRQMLPGSRQDAEDALQDIFVRAYSGLRANDRELSLRAWLYRVAHNRCVDELRRPLPPTPEVLGILRPPSHDPTVQAEQRESLRRLIEDVRRLPDQQRSALLMRELGGMAYADVSGALGVSVPAVKSLLVRARIGLAQALEARDTACCEIREELILAHDRGVRPSGLARRHMHDCSGCRAFRGQMRGVSRQFAALAPTLGPIGVIANLLGLGGGGGAGAAAASGAGGGVAAAGGAVGTGGAVASAGVLAGGVGHVATLLAAAVVTAGGAVGLEHTIISPSHHARHHAHATADQAAASQAAAAPVTAAVSEGTSAYQPPAAPALPVSPRPNLAARARAAHNHTQSSTPPTTPSAPVSGGSAPGGLATGGVPGTAPGTSGTDTSTLPTDPSIATTGSTGTGASGTTSSTTGNGATTGTGSTTGTGTTGTSTGTPTGTGTSGTGSSGPTATTSSGPGSTTPPSSTPASSSTLGGSGGSSAIHHLGL